MGQFATMSEIDFRSWLQTMGRGGRALSDRQAAESLGSSRSTVRGYREGAVKIPRHVALACAALAFGLPPWRRG